MLTRFQVKIGQGPPEKCLNLAGKWPQQWLAEMNKNKGKNNEKRSWNERVA